MPSTQGTTPTPTNREQRRAAEREAKAAAKAAETAEKEAKALRAKANELLGITDTEDQGDTTPKGPGVIRRFGRKLIDTDLRDIGHATKKGVKVAALLVPEVEITSRRPAKDDTDEVVEAPEAPAEV